MPRSQLILLEEGSTAPFSLQNIEAPQNLLVTVDRSLGAVNVGALRHMPTVSSGSPSLGPGKFPKSIQYSHFQHAI